jgi:hypothetical protein
VIKTKLGTILILLVLFPFANCCKKEINTPDDESIITTTQVKGLPANHKKINGYFFAMYWDNKGDSNYFRSANIVAAFADPTSDILGNFNHYNGWIDRPMNKFANIDYHGVFINGFKLDSELVDGNFFYQRRIDGGNFNSKAKAHLNTGGNRSFPPLDLFVERGFPTLTSRKVDSLTINIMNDFPFNYRDFISNIDSVAFSIRCGPFLSLMIKKQTSEISPLILFGSHELQFLKPYPTAVVAIEAFNYSSHTVANKQFIYELAVRIDREVRIDTIK